MSQHDMDIATGDANTGTTMRAAINASLQALASTNSGATEPSTMYAFQMWADTANDLLKVRNAANNAWITIGTLSATNLGLATLTNALLLAGGTMTGKIVLDGDGTIALHPTPARQIQKGSLIFIADTGAVDVYVATLVPALAAYTSGMEICVKIVNANTIVAPTLNVNALGAKTIKRINGAALNVGDLPASHYAVLRYDGTDFILLNPALHTHKSVAQGGVLLNLGTEQASTSGTAIDFTSIPAGTKRITIMFVGVSTDGTNDMIVQLGDAGGLETSGYSGGVSTGASAVAINSSGFDVCHTTQAARTYIGSMTLYLENASTNTWIATSTIWRSDATEISYIAASKSLSAELDRIRITSAGTPDDFDAGAINIQYE